MKNVRELLGQISQQQGSVLVLGAGRTGIALAKFFLNSKIRVAMWDESTRVNFLKNIKNQQALELLASQGVTFNFDGENKELPQNCLLLVPSPGVPSTSALYQNSHVRNLPLISELELGMQLFAEVYGAKQIVVTGSNGKSTTTALIHHILKELNFNSILCGNIGDPVVEMLPPNCLTASPQKSDIVLAIEASSYQLEACKLCKPDVAVMLNLTENHLVRHGNMSAYLEAKKNLVRRFAIDSTLVINSDDSYTDTFCSGIEGVHRKFGSDVNSEACIDLKSKQIKFAPSSDNISYEQSRGHLLGDHNMYNIAAAILACRSIGADLNLAIKAAYGFKSLEHRLEMIQLTSDKLAINDSKATTVQASLAACKAVVSSDLNRKIILLLGGEEKRGSDWLPLVDFITQNKSAFKELWLFGECSRKLQVIFGSLLIEIKRFEKLADIKTEIPAALSHESLILLSPGCASFDEFTRFEHRGEVFKDLITNSIGLTA